MMSFPMPDTFSSCLISAKFTDCDLLQYFATLNTNSWETCRCFVEAFMWTKLHVRQTFGIYNITWDVILWIKLNHVIKLHMPDPWCDPHFLA